MENISNIKQYMKKNEMSEINQVKVDLRNMTTMYENQKELNQELKNENKELKLMVEKLLEKIKQQDYLIAKLMTKIDKLEKNSSNSSKPPSTDIVKKNKSLRGKSNNKSGGQKGHDGCCEKQTDNPDKVIECKPNKCSVCGKDIPSNAKFRFLGKKQVIDISEIIKIVTEYRLMGAKCKCGHKEKGNYPKDVNGPVSYGTNLQSFVGYLSVTHSIPQKRITHIFSDILGTKMSVGTIDNILSKTKDKLKGYSKKILEIIKSGNWVGSDETGVRVKKENRYCWTWQNDLGSYYFSKKSRAYQVIYDIFGENYNGTLLHDCFAAQNNTVAKDHQLCHPHLLRDLIFCLESENSVWAYDMINLLLKSAKARETIWGNGFEEHKRKEIINYYVKQLDIFLEIIPTTKETLRLYKRFKKHKMMIFTFMNYKDVPHHNNSSELAIRSHKIKKKVSGCFRSDEGIERHDTILSFIETMKKQNRDILESLKQAIEGKFFFCIN